MTIDTHKVIAVNDTAHGTELVTKAETKTDIRKNIIDWIKSHNK